MRRSWSPTSPRLEVARFPKNRNWEPQFLRNRAPYPSGTIPQKIGIANRDSSEIVSPVSINTATAMRATTTAERRTTMKATEVIHIWSPHLVGVPQRQTKGGGVIGRHQLVLCMSNGFVMICVVFVLQTVCLSQVTLNVSIQMLELNQQLMCKRVEVCARAIFISDDHLVSNLTGLIQGSKAKFGCPKSGGSLKNRQMWTRIGRGCKMGHHMWMFP